MQHIQKEIFYIVGDDEWVLRNSPLLESYKKNNIEVLILDDKEIDEVIAPAIGQYKEWDMKDVTSCEAPKTEQTEEEAKEVEEKFKSIVEKITGVLGDAIKEVKTTTRLSDSPSCVVKDSSDPMASMAAMFVQMGQEAPQIPLILEINPDSQMIQKMQKLEDKDLFEDAAWVLLDSAKLAEGLEPTDSTSFAKRVASLATKAL